MKPITVYAKTRILREMGFTLLEVLVALIIFTILAWITGTVIYHMMNTQQAVYNLAEKLHQRQIALNIIENDLQQAVPATILRRENTLLLQRLGFTNPQATANRSEIQLVRYYVDDQQLWRVGWTENEAQPKPQAILQGISSLTIELFPAVKPQAIKFILRFSDEGELPRFITLPTVLHR